MRLDDLSPDALAILEALIHARLAWHSPRELRSSAGLDHDSAEEALADLQLGGWIQPWETDDGLDVTLSAIAAEILGVHLVEFGPDEIPTWAPLLEPEPRPPKAKGCFGRYSALALVADRELRPDQQAQYNEDLEEELAKVLPLNLETSTRGAEERERRRLREAARRSEKAREARRAKRSRLLARRRHA